MDHAFVSFFMSSLTMDMLLATTLPVPATRAPVKAVVANPSHPAIPAAQNRGAEKATNLTL